MADVTATTNWGDAGAVSDHDNVDVGGRGGERDRERGLLPNLDLEVININYMLEDEPLSI